MKKLGVICLALVLALGSLGVAYAAWNDEVIVEGTVQNGSLILGISDCAVRDGSAPVNVGGDYPTNNPDQSILPGFVGNPFYLDKNVAWGDCSLEDLDGDGINDKAYFNLYNTYPCYFNAFAFYPYNAGTIPLRINSVLIEWEGGSQLLTENDYIGIDVTGDGYNDIEILWGNNFGAQLHEGQQIEVSFWIHVLQEAPQNATLSFTATMMAVQWNEYPYSHPLPPA